MNTKAILLALYLLFLIGITVRISCMKKLNEEATVYLVVAVVLGLLVLLVQRRKCCSMCPLLCMCGKKCKKCNKENFQAADINYRLSDELLKKASVKGIFKDEGGSPLDYLVSNHDGIKATPDEEDETVNEKKSKEKPDNYKGGAPLDYRMGPYSNVKLNAEELQKRRILAPGFTKDMYLNEIESNCGDLKSPCNVPYQNPKFITPTGLETEPELSKQENPSIDGKKDSKRSMFMFSHNVCHPGCCPSTYSCDHGCVCTNKDQREYLGNHGAMKRN